MYVPYSVVSVSNKHFFTFSNVRLFVCHEFYVGVTDANLQLLCDFQAKLGLKRCWVYEFVLSSLYASNI